MLQRTHISGMTAADLDDGELLLSPSNASAIGQRIRLPLLSRTILAAALDVIQTWDLTVVIGT